MEKNSFVLYTDYYEYIKDLTDEEKGQLITAIFEYAIGNNPVIESRVVGIAFSFIKGRLDKDKAKYEDTCKKRAEAGSKGGKQKVANQANAIFANQIVANQADNDNDNVNDNDNDKKESIKKSSRFSPPSLEEVKAYIREQGYKVDAERFVDFYESKNWMVGKNKMKDWRAAVRNWSRQDVSGYQSKAVSNSKIHNYNERTYNFDELMSEVANGN